jgi:hypothetical protein
MISYKKSLSIVFLLFSVSMLQAQDVVTMLLSKGDKSYNDLQYSNALAYYRQAYVRASKSATPSSKKEDASVISHKPRDISAFFMDLISGMQQR